MVNIRKLKKIPLIKNIGLFLLYFGFNPITFFNSFKNIPKFISHYILWKKKGGKVTKFLPILNEFDEESGVASGQYFHQDLLVAQKIFNANPTRHVDIASRVDGFVAHVASFRQIEVFDIRPLKTNHKNIIFKKIDLSNFDELLEKTASLSCLHSLEHIGLGRYSDPIEIDGFEKALRNLINLLSSGGTLYISFPIGQKDEVHFNAHKVFHPMSVLKNEDVKNNLTLQEFDYVDEEGDLFINQNIQDVVGKFNFALGIYTFKKL